MKHFLTTRRQHRDHAELLAGVIYGVLAGITYAAIVWGISSIRLANASAGYPWFTLILGAFLCAFIGGLAGLITSWADSSAAGGLTWLIAGITFGWIASRLPFYGMTVAMHLLDPGLQDIEFTSPENIQRRMIVVYSLLLVCTTLVGILQPILVEAASNARSRLMRYLILGVAGIFLILAGLVTYDNINQLLTTPVLAVDDLLQFHQQLDGRPVSARESAERHYRALAPILDLADKPYRLYLSGFDAEFMQLFTVLIDFQGEYAECSVFFDSVGTCKLGMGFTKP